MRPRVKWKRERMAKSAATVRDVVNISRHPLVQVQAANDAAHALKALEAGTLGFGGVTHNVQMRRYRI